MVVEYQNGEVCRMAEIPRHKVRDIAIIGPHGAGKTTLDEGLLFISGVTDKLGSVESGSSQLDYLQEEKERHMSINSHISFYEYKSYLVNILDTPGFANFMYETQCALRVSDSAIVVISAVPDSIDKVKRFWDMSGNANVTRMIFMNDMDKQYANFENSYAELQKIIGIKPVPLTIPIGQEQDFRGVIDLVQMKALIYSEGTNFEVVDIPGDLMEYAGNYREIMVESVAMLDDELLEKYLQGEKIDNEKVLKDLRQAIMNGDICPLLVGSASTLIGLHSLMDAINFYLPSVQRSRPVDCVDMNGKEVKREPKDDSSAAMYVFKTISDPFAGKISIAKVISGTITPEITLNNSYNHSKIKLGHISRIIGKKEEIVDKACAGDIIALNKLKDLHTGCTLSDTSDPCVIQPVNVPQPVISFAIEPKTRSDEDKLSTSLAKIIEEDPTIEFRRDQETGDFLISGTGQTHIEVVVDKLNHTYGVNVDLKTPHVPYRETVTSVAEAEGKYVKQTGGRGQYGVASIRLEPVAGKDFQFEDNIVGGVIPKNFIPSVEKGVLEAMKHGVLAGYPVTGVKVILFDGKHHKVDSSDIAYQIAASQGFKKAMENAGPTLLEPIMSMSIYIPDDCMGDVIGDLNSRRGKVSGVDSSAAGHRINAFVPMSEVLSYAPELRSLTHGRGSFNMEFSHYEELPSHLTKKVVEERKVSEEKSA